MMSCYYPTTIIAIDDDKDFLNTINQHSDLANCEFFTSPQKAIDLIIQQSVTKRVQSRLLRASNTILKDENTAPDNYSLSINLRKLHEEIYSSERFRDISVLIVDYHMDEISGIDLCQKLARHPSKKILLTGGTDKEKIAIEAFNKGIINRFINKSDSNFPAQLKQTISILQDAYFKDLSQSLIPKLPRVNYHLQTASYSNFTRNLQVQLNAIEYYILDMSGSILYLDTEGNPAWMVVKSDDELKDYEQILNNSDHQTKELELLSKREKIPFFFSDSDFQQPVSDWNRYLYHANPFPGIKGYYYSIINGHVRDAIEKNKIISYATYNHLRSKNIIV